VAVLLAVLIAVLVAVLVAVIVAVLVAVIVVVLVAVLLAGLLAVLVAVYPYFVHVREARFTVWLGTFAKCEKRLLVHLRHVCFSVRPYISPSACNNSSPTRCISLKLDFLENLSRKFSFINSDNSNRYFTRRPIYVHL